MNTLLLFISFGIIYLALKQVYRNLDKIKAWNHRSGLACYILASAVLFLFIKTLSYWILFLGGCDAFRPLSWDTGTILTIGLLLWILLGVSVIKTFKSQRKVTRVMALASPCTDRTVNQYFSALCQRMGMNKPILMTYRSNHPYAATLFWKEPVILLSSWMLESLDEEQLEAVLAHELAHIQRKDNLIVPIGGILKDILFFLPTIQKTWKKFLGDLELAADDVAVLVTKQPIALASALLRVHQERPKMELAYGISHFTADSDQLTKRVERLLSKDIEHMAQAATGKFSTLLFGRDILVSGSLLVLILVLLFSFPYCHWLAQHHL